MVSKKDFQKSIINRDSIVILDVRPLKEYNLGHIKHAINAERVSSLLLDKWLKSSITLFLYGANTQAGINIATTLTDNGLKNVFVLEGGFEDWVGKSFPFVSNNKKNKLLGDYTIDTYHNAASYHKNVLFYFYADWCKPCKIQEPILHHLISKYPNYKLIKINIDRNTTLQSYLEIEETPTIILFKQANQVYRHSGLIKFDDLKKEVI